MGDNNSPITLECFINYIRNFNNDIEISIMKDEHVEEFLELIMKNFNLLSNKDKLKFMLTDTYSEITCIHNKDTAIKEEEDEVERDSKYELLRLRTWLVKFFSISIIMILISYLIISVFVSGAEQSGLHEFMKTVFEIINIFFKEE